MQKKHLTKYNHHSSPKKKKKFNKWSIVEAYLNIIKIVYNKPTATIILNDGRLKAFPLRSGSRQGCLLSPFQLNIELDVLARAVGKKNQ